MIHFFHPYWNYPTAVTKCAIPHKDTINNYTNFISHIQDMYIKNVWLNVYKFSKLISQRPIWSDTRKFVLRYKSKIFLLELIWNIKHFIRFYLRLVKLVQVLIGFKDISFIKEGDGFKLYKLETTLRAHTYSTLFTPKWFTIFGLCGFISYLKS